MTRNDDRRTMQMMGQFVSAIEFYATLEQRDLNDWSVKNIICYEITDKFWIELNSLESHRYARFYKR